MSEPVMLQITLSICRMIVIRHCKRDGMEITAAIEKCLEGSEAISN
jgi:endonuclease V-like protein UPF0215 family